MNYIINILAFCAVVAYYCKDFIYTLGDTATILATIAIAVVLVVCALHNLYKALNTEC